MKNKRTGVSKEFIEFLYFRLPKTQNILNLIKISKNKEELKQNGVIRVNGWKDIEKILL